MINRRRSGVRGTPAKVNANAGLAASDKVNSASVSDGSHESVYLGPFCVPTPGRRKPGRPWRRGCRRGWFQPPWRASSRDRPCIGCKPFSFLLLPAAESRLPQQPGLPLRRGAGRGGRRKIDGLARAGRLARPTPLRVSGAVLGGPHGAVYFPSGTKGQQPWCSPQSGPPGEAAQLCG